jgi:hypothetical protein
MRRANYHRKKLKYPTLRESGGLLFLIIKKGKKLLYFRIPKI